MRIAYCPAGKRALGGDFSATNSRVNLYESKAVGPLGDDELYGWFVGVWLDGISATITPNVVCAYVAD